MGNVFNKQPPKANKITDTDRAVLQLKTQRRQLNAQRKRVEGLIAREVEVAKELLAAKKRERALLALRKKRLREGQLEQIDAYLLNVEQVLANIESAQRQNRLYDALKQGNIALAALQQEVSVEDVEKLMDDSREAKEYEDRVRQLLGEALSAEDDAEVLQELSALEAEREQAERAALPAVPAIPKAEEEPVAAQLSAGERAELERLPAVPTKKVPARAAASAAASEEEEPIAA